MLTLILSACGSVPRAPTSSRGPESGKGNEVVLFALGLIDTGYRFGGKNPEAGLDCSGMVAYIYDRSLGLKVSGRRCGTFQYSRAEPPERRNSGSY